MNETRTWLVPFTKLFFEPLHAIESGLEVFGSWWTSRRWSLLLYTLPAWILLFSVAGIVTYGTFADRSKMLERYLVLAESEFSDKSSRSDSSGAEQTNNPDEEDLGTDAEPGPGDTNTKVSAYGEMLYRRVLQLEDSNQRATYFVALQMSRRGAAVQARNLMARIAPNDKKGFPPAHAWMVQDMISKLQRNGNADGVNTKHLRHHLQTAAQSDQASPQVLFTYASLLASEGDADQAIQVAERTAKIDQGYYLDAADLAGRLERQATMKQFAVAAMAHFKRQAALENSSLKDWLGLTQAQVMTGELDQAIQTVQEGMKKFGDAPELKRALSNVILLKYRSSITQTKGGFQADIGLLDAALNADPTNPEISQHVAQIIFWGGQADQALNDALHKQLADGRASTVTHMLLANKQIVDGNVKKAIPHLEVAHSHKPDAPLILNNLAMALVIVENPDYRRAEELIQKCLTISGPVPEFLDTKGEIAERQGKLFDAISSYEQAIRLEPNRIKTRQKLVKCYRQANMEEMAAAHEKAIANVAKKEAKVNASP